MRRASFSDDVGTWPTTKGADECAWSGCSGGDWSGDDSGSGDFPAPHVESIVSMRDKPGASAAAAPAHKQSCDFTMKDDQWLDTGVALAAGEQANFTATGSFMLSAGEWLVRMGWTGMEGPATAVSAELG